MFITARKMSLKLALSTAVLVAAAGLAAGTAGSANAAPAKGTQSTAAPLATWGHFSTYNDCHFKGLEGKANGSWSSFTCIHDPNGPTGFKYRLDYQP